MSTSLSFRSRRSGDCIRALYLLLLTLTFRTTPLANIEVSRTIMSQFLSTCDPLWWIKATRLTE